MDKIDWKIISELETDGRLSFAELGKRVGLSKSPCWGRVRNLEEQGVIEGFSAAIDPAALGLTVQCMLEVRIRLDSHEEFEAAAIAHPAVIECHTTAGENDYILRIFARSVEHLDQLLRHEIAKLPGVHRVATNICLKTIKSRSSLTRWANASRLA